VLRPIAKLLSIGAFVLVAGGVPVASAAAAGGTGILVIGSGGSSVESEFDARASHGYAIQVSASDGEVALSASGEAGTASYSVAGRASAAGIDASFGKLGSIDVEFKPGKRRRAETPPGRCEGKQRITRWGVFVGTIRFAGEHGFTHLDATRVPGLVRRSPHWKCKRPHGHGRGSPVFLPDRDESPPIIFEGGSRGGAFSFNAYAQRPAEERGLTLFSVSLSERRRRVRIFRTVFTLGNERSFSFDQALTTATLAPPKPFSGSATFQRRSDDAPVFAGTLAVALPGTGKISLAGAGSHPRLYRETRDGIAKPGG
jgi:hypothetical protein